MTLSAAPATMPARIPRAGESFPLSSFNIFLMESNDKNRTPALNVVPLKEIRTALPTLKCAKNNNQLNSLGLKLNIPCILTLCHLVWRPVIELQKDF